jgi:hypothetical protein
VICFPLSSQSGRAKVKPFSLQNQIFFYFFSGLFSKGFFFIVSPLYPLLPFSLSMNVALIAGAKVHTFSAFQNFKQLFFYIILTYPRNWLNTWFLERKVFWGNFENAIHKSKQNQ